MNIPSMRLLVMCLLASTLAAQAAAPPPVVAALAAAAASSPADASQPLGRSPLTPDTLERALALASAAAAAIAPAGARVQVQAGQLDPRLALAACGRVEPYLGKGLPAWGRTRVGLRCGDGVVRWNVFLPVTVQVWAPALVSTVSLPPGARLSETQLVLADTDWAAAPQAPFLDARMLAGRTLARPLAPGQPLRQSDLQPRQWFAIGDRVRVDARGDGFSVQAEGHALGPGMEGQPVRVRVGEEGASRVVVGRAVAEGRIEVRL